MKHALLVAAVLWTMLLAAIAYDVHRMAGATAETRAAIVRLVAGLDKPIDAKAQAREDQARINATVKAIADSIGK